MGKNYSSYMDATVQQYEKEITVARGQLDKLYQDYRELEALYNTTDEDIMQWDTEQDRVECAGSRAYGEWNGERFREYESYLYDTMGIVFRQYRSTYEAMQEELWIKMDEIAKSIGNYEDQIANLESRKAGYQKTKTNEKKQAKNTAVKAVSAKPVVMQINRKG